MSERIQAVVEQIRSLEDELRELLHEQETRALYEIRGTKVRFERAIHLAHRKFKKGVVRWFFSSEARNIASAPFIYSMILPMAVYDLWLTMYQAICFRLYGIPRVERADYIVIDRHRLGYLNAIEKLNCVYCGYANGLIAYAREITARTEQYWCPIKHARKVLGSHSRYSGFLDYAAPETFHEGQRGRRRELTGR